MAENNEAADRVLREKREVRLKRIEWAKEHHRVKAGPKSSAELPRGSGNPAEVVDDHFQAEYMKREDRRKRTAEFGRNRPDHATGKKSGQRRRSVGVSSPRVHLSPEDMRKRSILIDEVRNELSRGLVKTRGRRDEAAAQQAVEESEVVVLSGEETPYNVNEELERRVKAGEFAGGKREIFSSEDEADAASYDYEDEDHYQARREEAMAELDDPVTSEERRDKLREWIRESDEEEGARLAKDERDIKEVRLKRFERENMTERSKPSNARGAARVTRNPWTLKKV